LRLSLSGGQTVRLGVSAAPVSLESHTVWKEGSGSGIYAKQARSSQNGFCRRIRSDTSPPCRMVAKLASGNVRRRNRWLPNGMDEGVVNLILGGFICLLTSFRLFYLVGGPRWVQRRGACAALSSAK
jgi:hypothetical protein